MSEILLCCFCDNPAVQDRPGAPLCAECWQRCERKAREAKPVVVALCSDPADLLQRHHARLIASGQHELAGFVGVVAALGCAPKGTTVQ
jgi:hypothetical protein